MTQNLGTFHEIAASQTPEDADLYRFDGRFYDLSEVDGVLSLQLRRSVRVEWGMIAILVVVLNFILVSAAAWFFGAELDAAFTATGSLAVRQFSIQFSITFAVGYFFQMMRGEVWKFDKSAAKVHANTLQLRYGQKVKLGRFAFGRSEYAWRRDAAQIAAFLNVPLEIPPP